MTTAHKRNQMQTTLSDATSVPHKDLWHAMRDAFQDYAIPVNLTLAGFTFMMQQRGLHLGASRVVMVNGKIAAIWLISVRDNKSYLISSGTVPKYHRRGLAKQLGQDALSGLRNKGVKSFQTEVLVENAKAAGLYHELGMRTARNLPCYTVHAAPNASRHRVTETPWSTLSAIAPTLRDWVPSWQNSDLSVSAVSDSIRCFQSADHTGVTGYAVIAPGTTNLLQIGVRPDARRQGIGTALVHHSIQAGPGAELRLTNIDGSDIGFAHFMGKMGALETQGQYELHMSLT